MSHHREHDDGDEYDLHHIIPRSKGGSDDKRNLLRVKRKFHRMYHGIFLNLTPDEIVEFLYAHWFKSNLP